MSEHRIISGLDRPGETDEQRRERMAANRTEFERRDREDTPADNLRHRLAALVDDDDLAEAEGSISAVRGLHALIVMGGDLDKLNYYQLDGLCWLLGHAELDNDLTWCGQWHVGGRL